MSHKIQMNINLAIHQNVPKNGPDGSRTRPHLATKTGHKNWRTQERPKLSDKIREQVRLINDGLELCPRPKVARLVYDPPLARVAPSSRATNSGSPPKSSLLVAKEHNYGSAHKKDSPETEKKNDWWTRLLAEKKGDPSKVMEITISDDDEPEKGVIEVKNEDWDLYDIKMGLMNKVKAMERQKKMVQDYHQDIVKRRAQNRKAQHKVRALRHEKDSLEKKLDRECDRISDTLIKNQIWEKIRDLNSNSQQVDKLDLDKCLDGLAVKTKVPMKEPLFKPLFNKNEMFDNEKDMVDSKGVSDDKPIGSTKILKPSNHYFCIFCTKVCETSDSAKDHYLAHLGLYLECRECRQKFPTLPEFRRHNSLHTTRDKMMNLEEFMAAKKWVDNYIDNYVERHEDLLKSFMFTYQMFCPVCHQIRHMSDENDLKSTKIDVYYNKCKVKFTEEMIRNHLYEHFQYFPFECIDCQFDDKKTEFCLNEKARQHLSDVHCVKNAMDMKTTELKTFFGRRKPIEQLDTNIEKCVSISLGVSRMWKKTASKVDRTKIYRPGS